jgi:hypothetical protein
MPLCPFFGMPLKARFAFYGMLKNGFSGIVAYQQKSDPISCGTVLKLRLLGLRVISSWASPHNIPPIIFE